MRVWQIPRTLTYKDHPGVGAALAALRQMVQEDAGMLAEVDRAYATLGEPPVAGTTTVVEVVLPMLDAWHVNPDTTLQRTFGMCLEHLNLVLRTYAITSGDLRVGAATRHSLGALIPFVLQDPAKKTWSDVHFFSPNPTLPLPHVPTDIQPEFTARFWNFLNRLYREDPLSGFLDWELIARKAHVADGNYALCIVAAHIATEVLFDSLLLLMAWEEGIAGDVALKWFQDETLAKRLRTYYGPRLGGNWDPSAPKAVTAEWNERLATIRNQVVHRGFHPTDRQAREALDTVQRVHEDLERRIAAKRSKYPRTTLLFVGQEGLQLLGLYSGKIKRYSEQQTGTGLQWFDEYRDWLET